MGLVAGTYGPATTFFLNGLLGSDGWTTQWQFWFLESLVWVTVGALALVAVPAFDRLERRSPYAVAIGLVLTALAVRFAWVGLYAGATERYTVGVVAWWFLLGWAATRADSPTRRWVVVALAALGTVGFFGDPVREALVVGGIALLVLVPTVRVPRRLVGPVSVVASSSLFVYLTHWQVYPHLEDVFPLGASVALVRGRHLGLVGLPARAAAGRPPAQPVSRGCLGVARPTSRGPGTHERYPALVPETTPLQKVLIANRGEIAVRVIRACKDAGIGSVAVYADPDRDALFVRLADEAHAWAARRRPTPTSTSPRSSRSRRSPAPTRCTPATASSPRTPSSPRRSSTPGCVWIGPPPEAIENLGDKVKARHIAEKVGAPLAPGTKDPLENADEAVAFAEEYGLPIAIKAAFGGGGRGLKVAREMDEVADAFESAVREAVTAFGRGECFVEKFLDQPRHVETQCLADQHGNVVVVSTRDCSLQRRHQKLVEEAPAPFLTDDQVDPALRVVEGDPARGRLRRRRHLRVPGRQGRHHLLPRGQHPPPGRALRLRGGHRHRPGPRDVPHRGRRGARVRRPGGPRPLDRVPHQRRGRRPQLHARPRHAVRLAARPAAPASASTAATTTARPSRARSTPSSPS